MTLVGLELGLGLGLGCVMCFAWLLSSGPSVPSSSSSEEEKKGSEGDGGGRAGTTSITRGSIALAFSGAVGGRDWSILMYGIALYSGVK